MSLTRTDISYLDFCHNPGGFGCSAKCDGCWARRIAPRVGTNIGCEKCVAFVPHLHPERLGDPAKRKTPAVIGVQFTGELFEPGRLQGDMIDILRGCECPHHEMVFLTQRPSEMAEAMQMYWDGPPPEYWWLGVTSRTQQEIYQRLGALSEVEDAMRWASLEPLLECVNLGGWQRYLRGVIVGCDNRRRIPWDNAWARQVLAQCREYNVSCYIKQIRSEDGRVLTNPVDFPEDLRVRELPWRLTL